MKTKYQKCKQCNGSGYAGLHKIDKSKTVKDITASDIELVKCPRCINGLVVDDSNFIDPSYDYGNNYN